MRFSYVGLGFGGGAGQGIYEGTVSSQHRDKCNRIYSVPYSIQLYLLCPFTTWKETFMAVSGLLYLHHKTGSSKEIQISMTFF